jgi:hypothetical protein
MILTALIVLLSTFAVGVLYSVYVKALASNKMLKAAIFGELVVICGAITTINYVDDIIYLIPAVVGGFVGTLLTNPICKLLRIK